jgi:hypothetical protein
MVLPLLFSIGLPALRLGQRWRVCLPLFFLAWAQG